MWNLLVELYFVILHLPASQIGNMCQCESNLCNMVVCQFAFVKTLRESYAILEHPLLRAFLQHLRDFVA